MVPTTPFSTPCPSGYGGTPPNCTSASRSASFDGKVVDRDTASPLKGEPIALEPYVPADATPMAEGTSGPDGTFSSAAQPGHYLLFIGSNSPTDMRATVHDNITLVTGTNHLRAPDAPPVPTVTPPPSETSGNYRLMTLNSAQAPCLTAVNGHRQSLGLPALVPDEWLEENAYEINVAQNALNMTTFASGGIVTQHEDATGGHQFVACSGFEDLIFNPNTFGVWSAYPMATASGTVWYGGAFSVAAANQPNPGSSGAFEEWGYDPRIDSPCASPAPNPLPAPEPGACDPDFEIWP